jgi:hypothetical protein
MIILLKMCVQDSIPRGAASSVCEEGAEDLGSGLPETFH